MSKADEFATLLRSDPDFQEYITVFVLDGGHLAVSHKLKTYKKPVSWNPDQLATTSYKDLQTTVWLELLS